MGVAQHRRALVVDLGGGLHDARDGLDVLDHEHHARCVCDDLLRGGHARPHLLVRGPAAHRSLFQERLAASTLAARREHDDVRELVAQGLAPQAATEQPRARRG